MSEGKANNNPSTEEAKGNAMSIDKIDLNQISPQQAVAACVDSLARYQASQSKANGTTRQNARKGSGKALRFDKDHVEQPYGEDADPLKWRGAPVGDTIDFDYNSALHKRIQVEDSRAVYISLPPRTIGNPSDSKANVTRPLSCSCRGRSCLTLDCPCFRAGTVCHTGCNVDDFCHNTNDPEFVEMRHLSILNAMQSPSAHSRHHIATQQRRPQSQHQASQQRQQPKANTANSHHRYSQQQTSQAVPLNNQQLRNGAVGNNGAVPNRTAPVPIAPKEGVSRGSAAEVAQRKDALAGNQGSRVEGAMPNQRLPQSSRSSPATAQERNYGPPPVIDPEQDPLRFLVPGHTVAGTPPINGLAFFVPKKRRSSSIGQFASIHREAKFPPRPISLKAAEERCMNSVKQSFAALREHQEGPHQNGVGLVSPEEVLPSLTTDLKHLATSMQTAKLQSMTSFRQMGDLRVYTRNKRPESTVRTDARATKRREVRPSNADASHLLCEEEEEVFSRDKQSKDDEALKAKTILASQETALLRAATQLIREQTRRLTQRRLDAAREWKERRKNAMIVEERNRLMAEKNQKKRKADMRKDQDDSSRKKIDADSQPDGSKKKSRAKGKGESRRGKKDSSQGKTAGETKQRKTKSKKAPNDASKAKKRKNSRDGNVDEATRQTKKLATDNGDAKKGTGSAPVAILSQDNASESATAVTETAPAKNGTASIPVSHRPSTESGNGAIVPSFSVGRPENTEKKAGESVVSNAFPSKDLAKNIGSNLGVEKRAVDTLEQKGHALEPNQPVVENAKQAASLHNQLSALPKSKEAGVEKTNG